MENNKKEWFKYKGMGWTPKPISWEGWVCYGIFFLSLFISTSYIIINVINPIVSGVDALILITTLMIVAKLKSNYKELISVYKEGL